jgi:chemotaxis family two-component system response regulator Rcp1
MSAVLMLYVEDNPNDVLLLKTGFKLRHFALEMEIARDGVEALEFLRREGPKPNMILLDLNLPKKSGYQVLEELKNDPHLKAIRVVIYSGSANKRDAEHCLRLGASEFLSKPSDMEGILNIVDRIRQLLQ